MTGLGACGDGCPSPLWAGCFPLAMRRINCTTHTYAGIMSEFSEYVIYVDESGDHSLTNIILSSRCLFCRSAFFR